MCCRNEKSFLVDTKQTGAGLSKVQHIISASLDEILQQLQVQSGHLGYFYYLSVWYSVSPPSLCRLSKQNSSLIKKIQEIQTSSTLCSWSDSIIPTHVSAGILIFLPELFVCLVLLYINFFQSDFVIIKIGHAERLLIPGSCHRHQNKLYSCPLSEQSASLLEVDVFLPHC